jgi:hypothetical protein
MTGCWMILRPSESRTRVLLMQGQDELLRAELPPLRKLHNERSVTRLLEAVSLWLDQRVFVALCADELGDSFRLGLTDEMGKGATTVFYVVEPLPLTHSPRPRRLRGVGDFGDLHQLWLWASLGSEL